MHLKVHRLIYPKTVKSQLKYDEITREEYIIKSDNDKKSLIVKYFNHMMSGKILLFVSLLLWFIIFTGT